jgi:hypothetical protein
MSSIRRILFENGLSIFLVTCFLVLIAGQAFSGHLQYNEKQQEHGEPEINFMQYLGTDHFLEATMENWESEFLQMFVFILFTTFLYQKGSAESKKLDEVEPVDKDPSKTRRKKDVPGPVRSGGLILKLYENSLSLVFLLLFLVSFVLHAVGGAGEYNQEQAQHGGQTLSLLQFMGTSRFWFESFQNWQSEFLAIASMVIFSIFLRQKGSPESKPVDSPHSETGKG